MWIFWALLSAVLVASRRPFEKKIINEIHHFTYGFLVQCISLPILVAITILSGELLNPFSLGLGFWLPVLVVSVGYYPLNTYLYKQVMKDGELSEVLPIQSLGPVFSLLLAWLTLGEAPGIVSAAGLILTVLGIYALGLKGRRLHHPLQPFREDRSSRAMLAGVLLVSLVSILDKVAVKASNPLFYSLASSVGAILTLLVAMRVSKQRVAINLRPFIGQLNIIGTLQGGTYATYLLAVASGPIAYVSALRSTNILMGSILGILLFKEKLTVPKITSFLLIIIGAVFLTFGSAK
jgi:uncharacterized membrane protein